VPLRDEHVELDSDPEVMRYLTGRASTRSEVLRAHERRMVEYEITRSRWLEVAG
jgi:hypothetical protein